MEKVVEGKVALVTGGGSGIGQAAAIEFAKQGAKVVVSDKNQDGGDQTVATIKDSGGEALFVLADVTNESDVAHMVQTTVDTYGRLDCAVNNAGIAGKLAFTADVSNEDWDENMNVNLRSVFLCMRAEVSQMLKQGGGSIVNIASAAGLVAIPGAFAYGAAKTAVVGMTKTCAIEYVKQGIRVNAICPSFVGTPLTQALGEQYPEFVQKIMPFQAIGRIGTPDEIANAVVWISSDECTFITGVPFPVDGGYVAQ